MSQDRDRWRALVTAVMDSRIPYIAGNFLTIRILLASLENSAPWSKLESGLYQALHRLP